MALCPVPQPGHPDMYGLGIRLAFYIQWIGLIIVEYLDESELVVIRLLGLALSAAAFIGLLFQTPTNHLSLAEAYLVLLLSMSIYIFMIPIYLWKAATRFDPYWDPLRCTAERRSPAFRMLNFVLLMALSCLGIWYWCAFVANRQQDCDEYGFFFSRVRVQNKAFIAFNAIIYFIILLGSLGLLVLRAGWAMNVFEKRKKGRRIRRVHKAALRGAKTFSNITVAAVLIAASELTISWNELPRANDIATVAQVIPLLVSSGIVIRVIFLYFARTHMEESLGAAWSGSSTSSGSSRRSSRKSYGSGSTPRPRPPPPPPQPYPPPPPPAARGPFMRPPPPPPTTPPPP